MDFKENQSLERRQRLVSQPGVVLGEQCSNVVAIVLELEQKYTHFLPSNALCSLSFSLSPLKRAFGDDRSWSRCGNGHWFRITNQPFTHEAIDDICVLANVLEHLLFASGRYIWW